MYLLFVEEKDHVMGRKGSASDLGPKERMGLVGGRDKKVRGRDVDWIGK